MKMLLPMSMLLLATPLLGSPSPAPAHAGSTGSTRTPRSIPVANSAHPSSYQNSNGTINRDYLAQEFKIVRVKYSDAQKGNARSANSATAPPATGRGARRVKKRERVDNFKRDPGVGSDGLINQSGIEYDGLVSIGTPPQTMMMVLDTGSADMWVETEGTAGATNTFQSRNSTTFVNYPTPFTVQYGTGKVAGTLASDVVTLAGLTVLKQFFGAVKIISSNFIGGPSAGILGMGFQSISTSGKVPFFQNLMMAGAVAENLFGFYLTRNSATGSEITLGGTNPTKYTSPIVYTPVTHPGYWQVAASAVVQGVNVGSTGAAIDTGTTFIYAPVELTKLIYAQIPGATPDSVDNAFVGAASAYWQYPCASLNYTTPPVGFSFPSLLPNTPPKTFYINALDFSIGMSSTDNTQCIGAIIGMDIKDFQGNLIAIIGDSFLKGWYSVYNFGKGKNSVPAVGFAPAI